jgi:hypothetical protein
MGEAFTGAELFRLTLLISLTNTGVQHAIMHAVRNLPIKDHYFSASGSRLAAHDFDYAYSSQ